MSEGVYLPPEAEQNQDWAKYLAVAMFLSTLCGFLFPFANIIIPLVLWVINKNKAALINNSGKEILNFQITFTIITFVLVVVQVINFVFLVQTPYALVAIGLTWSLLFIVSITNIIAMVIGAVKAYDGKLLNFPYKIHFIK